MTGPYIHVFSACWPCAQKHVQERDREPQGVLVLPGGTPTVSTTKKIIFETYVLWCMCRRVETNRGDSGTIDCIHVGRSQSALCSATPCQWSSSTSAASAATATTSITTRRDSDDVIFQTGCTSVDATMTPGPRRLEHLAKSPGQVWPSRDTVEAIFSLSPP